MAAATLLLCFLGDTCCLSGELEDKVAAIKFGSPRAEDACLAVAVRCRLVLDFGAATVIGDDGRNQPTRWSGVDFGDFALVVAPSVVAAAVAFWLSAVPAAGLILV